MPTFSRESTGLDVAQAFSDQIKGRTVVITGPSQGSLGAEAAKALAHGKPKNIILAGRTKSKIEPTIAAIYQIDASIQTHFVRLDLSSLDVTREAAKEIIELVPEVDILICSAGIMAPETYMQSKDGYEMQFASCHLGHFLLTGLLMPKLEGASHARVVSLTSMGYEASGFRDDWNFSNGETYDRWLGYGQAKTAVILFTSELARRGRQRGVEAFVLHPGLILSSGIMKAVNPEALQKAFEDSKAQAAAKGQQLDDPEQEKSLEQGCATTVVAALDPSLAGKSGAFLKDCHIATHSLKPHARDTARAQKLWALSEELTGQRFLSEA